MTKKITIIGLLAVVLILGLWDVLVASNDIEGDTITEVIAQAGTPLAFVIGFICGHLMWPRKGR